MKKDLLTQRNIPWIGMLKDLAVMTMFYVSIINFLLIAITAYFTTLRPFILIHAPWFKAWIFIGLLVLLALVLMFLEYKFVYASYFTFRNKQEYEHENLLRKKIEDLEKKLDSLSSLEEQLKSLSKKLGGKL